MCGLLNSRDRCSRLSPACSAAAVTALAVPSTTASIAARTLREMRLAGTASVAGVRLIERNERALGRRSWRSVFHERTFGAARAAATHSKSQFFPPVG